MAQVCSETAAGYGLHVAEGHVAKTGQQRLERPVKLRLARGGERRHRAAVKTHVETQYLVAAFPVFFIRILSGEFERRFDGFRAAVAEKRLIAEREPVEPFRQLDLGLDMVEIRDVDQLSGLFPDGGHHARMAMSEVTDGQAGYEIEIFFSVRIPDTASLATDQSDGVTPVGGGDVLFSVRDQCGIVHAFPQKEAI